MPKRLSLRRVLLASSALAPLGAIAALANPQGGVVVGGNANITGLGTNIVTIKQNSQNAIINWHTFNIGNGESVYFYQPNSSSAVLNRVTGGMGPSSIHGVMDANGRVFLVNPDGVLFGKGAKVSTAGFLATTSDITNANFMSGRYHFNIPGRPDASIVNNGIITAHSHGFAALVAPGVRNSGTITAHMGTVGLASANSFSLDFYGDQLIKLAPGDAVSATVRDVETGLPLNALVKNEGLLQANGGRVELTAAEARTVVDSVINNTGVIEARSVGSRNGKIVLGAATGNTAYKQTVKVSGKLDVSNKSGKGGKIQVTGQHIEVKAASFDASGTTGGGTVLIGGDTAGGAGDSSFGNIPQSHLEAGPVPNATSVSIDSASVINASATHVGDGGKVIVWADGHTSFSGHILATGGMEGGNGGFVEVSGKSTLAYSGFTDLRAPHGTWGMLLLDPGNLTIQSGNGGSNFTGQDGTDSILDVAVLQNALNAGSVTVKTGMGTGACTGVCNGDIIVAANILWSGPSTLTLSAFRNVQFNGGFEVKNTGSGHLVVRADATGTGTGQIIFQTFGAIVDWSNSTGTVTFYDNPQNGYGNPTDFTTAGQGPNIGVLVNNANQFQYFMLVNNAANLTSILQLTDPATFDNNYLLTQNIDGGVNGVLTGATYTYSGQFDGGGNTISNFNVIGPALFSAIGGTIKNLTLDNFKITANPNAQFYGILAGTALSGSEIANVHTSGTISGSFFNINTSAGGLVGLNAGTITDSSSAVNLSGQVGLFGAIGGLAGQNSGLIQDSSASGNVTFTHGSALGVISIGGLVGVNNAGASVLGSFATGDVKLDGITFGHAGGLVGRNLGLIGASYAEGDVSGNVNMLGGLVGFNSSGTITDSYATGDVVSTGASGFFGGLVGRNSGLIIDSFATGDVTATATVSPACNIIVNGCLEGVYAGGLVGANDGFVGSLSSSFATSAIGNVSVGSNGVAGGLVGLNFNGGMIDNATASGIVTGAAGTSGSQTLLGGLVGVNAGTIEDSSASGAVGSGANFLIAGGLVGANTLLVTDSSASGNVVVGSNSVAGGLVGSNLAFALLGQAMSGVISFSSASGDVSSAGASVALGGLVGVNASGAAIYDSFAEGDVSGSANLAANGCFFSFGCQFIHAGGLVGFNAGSIVGLFDTTYADGDVFVGSHGQAGGLVGVNTGIVIGAEAYGNVTGASGSSPDHQTVLGGLIGVNHGLVWAGTAYGNVGSSAADFLVAGGAIGRNSGMALFVGAEGNVTTGNFSLAGGAVGSNEQNSCGICQDGEGGAFFNSATVALAYSTGAVSAGTGSVAGGFVGVNSGFISDSYSVSSVSGQQGSVLGGFAGVNDLDGMIVASFAYGAVSTSQPNSWVGGFVGLNGGLITDSGYGTGANPFELELPANSTVQGGPSSLIGGFAGMNIGTISNSQSNAQIVAAGGGSVIGGFAGANFGSLTDVTAGGTINAPGVNIVGGLVGANGTLTLPDSAPPATFAPLLAAATLPPSSFPAGSIENSTANVAITAGAGSTIGSQVGVNNPVSLPLNPAVIAQCDATICTLIKLAVLTKKPDDKLIPDDVLAPPNMPGPNVQPPAPPVDALIQLTPPAAPGPGGQGGPGAGGPPQQGAPSQTPGALPVSVAPVRPFRAIPGIDGETRSNIPPLNETRFLANEVVLQFTLETTQAELQRVAQQIGGLQLLGCQNSATLGRQLCTFRITNGRSVRDVIRRLEQNQIVAVAQPNYTYTVLQAQPPADLAQAQAQPGANLAQAAPQAIPPVTAVTPRGDPAQYMMGKLHLPEAHRVASGSNVSIAVIDSEVDPNHAELSGTIVERFDATNSPARPHSHGTAMAGAIVSRDRLLGVAPGARILAVRAFSETQATAESTTTTIIRSIEWAIGRGARVINMSFAGPYDPTLERALKEAAAKGVIMIAASGNAGPKSKPLWPSADPNVIAVTATDSRDRLFRMANRGAYVSVASPGVEILAPAPDAGYQMSTGTSIATAHVSGIVALMLERDPTLTPKDVRLILEATASDLGPKGRDVQYGWGLVNPQRALEMVEERKRQPRSQAPAPANAPVQR